MWPAELRGPSPWVTADEKLRSNDLIFQYVSHRNVNSVSAAFHQIVNREGKLLWHFQQYLAHLVPFKTTPSPST